MTETERPDPLAPPAGYGGKPGKPEPEDNTCWMNARQCRDPVIAYVTMGDLQEHVFTASTCEAHLVMQRSMPLECTICRDSPLRPDPLLRILAVRRITPEQDYDDGAQNALNRVFNAREE